MNYRIPVVCPSKGRSADVKTLEFFPELTLVVPEKENELYKANYPHIEVLSPPAHVKGITATRQWILDRWEEVFMIDDDVRTVFRNFAATGEQYKINDPELVAEILNNTYEIAKGINAKIFAFSTVRHPLAYQAFKPIEHVGYFNASFCGFLSGHELSYDLAMNEGEDHYISCLNIYKHRYGLIENRYSFITDANFKATGGCNDYRTRESMIKNTIYLRKKFGEVIHYKEPSMLKMNVNIGERSLKFPF